ncbi:MAG: prolyl oligopeptidase family serine peptidase [Leptolyngbya sp.]|nr:prolyl oligopeptidase family serine peptidase [Candidatus Melainabacteria bacterium]
MARRSLIFCPKNIKISDRNDQIGREKLPLLLAFHGGLGRPEQMEKLTGFMALAETYGICVAYPEGIKRYWNDGRDLEKRRGIDDITFVENLIDHLRESLPIDQKRVYACGISNGGFFCQYLLTQSSSRFAAVASVAATVHEPMFMSLRPAEPVPIMFVVGDEDPVVPYAGGEIELAGKKSGTVVAFEQGLRYWVEHNKALTQARESILESVVAHDPTRIRRIDFDATAGGAPVVVFVVEGGGHTWPSGWQFFRERFIGKTSRQLDASRAILDFVMQYSK